MSECKHDGEYDSYPSSMPRPGWPFGVTCRKCKQTFAHVWWYKIPDELLAFELVTDNEHVGKGSGIPVRPSDEVPKNISFKDFA